MKSFRVLLILLMLTSITTLLLGRSINLEQCLKMLNKQNREIAAERYGIQAEKWRQRDALGNFLPQINFNSTIVRIDDDTYNEANAGFEIPGIGSFPSLMPINKTTYQNTITVQQSIFNGGKVIIGYQLAKIARQQAEQSLNNTHNDIVYSGVSNFIQILKLKDLQALAQLSLESSQTQLNTIEERAEVGLALESDILQWKVKVSNSEIALKEIENNLTIVKRIWHNQLNTNEKLDPEPIALEELTLEATRFAALTEEQKMLQMKNYLNEVKQNNPQLASLELSNLIMGKNYLLNKGNFLPSLNIQFTYEIEEDDTFDFSGNDNWNIAALISLPIFSGGKNLSNLNVAKYQKRKVEQTISAGKEQILVAAENSFRMMTITAEKIENNSLARESALENHRLINQYFEQGLATNTDLLNAETMKFNSEMNLTAATYDYLIQKYEMKKWANQ